MAGGERRRRGLAALAVAAAAALAAGALGVAAGATEEPPARRLDGVPVVRAEGCGGGRQGSGVVVRRNGVDRLLTNRHVVAGADRVTVDGRAAPVIGTVRGLDAAVVAAPSGAPALEVGPTPGVGDPVHVVGHPGGRDREARGRVVDVGRRAGRWGAAPVLVVGVDVGPGSSGGAVLDRHGRAVGLVAARDPASGHAVAIPVDVVLGAPVRSGPAGCG